MTLSDLLTRDDGYRLVQDHEITHLSPGEGEPARLREARDLIDSGARVFFPTVPVWAEVVCVDPSGAVLVWLDHDEDP